MRPATVAAKRFHYTAAVLHLVKEHAHVEELLDDLQLPSVSS
jgi:hypothetical protein